jgi:hypothetical protein
MCTNMCCDLAAGFTVKVSSPASCLSLHSAQMGVQTTKATASKPPHVVA